MTNQPNPEHFQPDIYQPEAQDLSFVPIEFETRDTIARDILDASTDTWTDTNTGQVFRRAHWDMPGLDDFQQPILNQFDLFELRNNEGWPYYVLDMWQLGESTKTYYTFSDSNNVMTYGVTPNDTAAVAPTQAALDRDISKHLLARHKETPKGLEAQARYDRRFHTLSGQISAENALARDVTGQLASEAQASDRHIRLRARKELYELAQTAGLYSDDLIFDLSLQNILTIHRQAAIAAAQREAAIRAINDTQPIPVVLTREPPQPYSDFEATPKTRRKLLRRLFRR